ncbi:pyridoxamine 5'-phosphate oxidase family protein [Paracoccus sp. p4-l81]|uniref:pyridoxamine 5'-phosphate oxidase family protein n=1 Tax=unclassified Paracoccus (in: a-proteobacteria) TaxID=2688777 RepID=UPI0035B9625D
MASETANATKDRATFWDRLDDVNAGMLGLDEGAALVPMSHQIATESDRLYFITAEGTDLQKAVAGGAAAATYVLAEGGKGLYARLHGKLSQNDDPAKLEEVWNFVADAWFEGGKRDDDVRLLELRLTEGEAWVTSKSGLRFLYEVAKARITGAEPDMGQHMKLRF